MYMCMLSMVCMYVLKSCDAVNVHCIFTEEIVHKINLILDGMTSEAKVDYVDSKGARRSTRT